MPSKKEIGAQAERAAAAFLTEKGYRILAKNFRYSHYEVDIIAQKGQLVVFVEVKARKDDTFGMPETFVSAAQAKRIKRVAEVYQERFPGDYNIRFDIVSLLGTPPHFAIEHFEDAFF